MTTYRLTNSPEAFPVLDGLDVPLGGRILCICLNGVEGLCCRNRTQQLCGASMGWHDGLYGFYTFPSVTSLRIALELLWASRGFGSMRRITAES